MFCPAFLIWILLLLVIGRTSLRSPGPHLGHSGFLPADRGSYHREEHLLHLTPTVLRFHLSEAQHGHLEGWGREVIHSWPHLLHLTVRAFFLSHNVERQAGHMRGRASVRAFHL